MGLQGMPPSENPEYPVEPSGDKKVLVVYFSHTGNTRTIAAYIHDAVKSDLMEIRTADAYPDAYDTLLAQVREEVATGYCPPLTTHIENLASYDVVFIGYPIWVETVAPPIRTFLTTNDLSGKTVVPFCASGTSSAEASYRLVRSLCPQSTVLEGIAIEASEVPSAESQVQDWLGRIGIERTEPQGAAVRITAGGHTFTGEWLDTPLANEIRGMFPLTATLGRYGGREYYGTMPQQPTDTEEGQLRFENGDITYCPSNNTIAIFYAKADDPDMGQLTMRIIPIGKVTSELGVFDEMENRLEFTFDHSK